jgi:membrane peptidoglycan carboxypeptidase
MANGGKLLAPYVAHTRQQENNFKVKVRRQVKMDPDAWQQMVPGMVGAVNYGSGRRAYDPGQTVVGKTGTCIEQGTWVGLFTSYAPLANPRLAVVVIARGGDGQSHFPAAVAGRIYRDLNGRFGAPADLHIAKARETYAPERSAFDTDDDENEEATASSKNSSGVSRPGGTNKTRSAQPLLRNTVATANSNVRPVLMQIAKRNQESGKTVRSSNVTTSNSSEGQTRPRRVFAER